MRPFLNLGIAAALLLAVALAGRAEEPPTPAGPPAPAGPCQGQQPESDAWLDSVQHGVYWGMCRSAVWFDGLFGGGHPDPGAEDVSGRLGVSTVWDDRDGVRPRLRLRARLPLPSFDNRVDLFLGRGDQRQLIQDRRLGASESLPTAFRDVNDAAWLLGLGYAPGGSLTQGVDFGIGVRLRLPPDPYVKGRYHYSMGLGERSVANFQETVFWQNSRSIGETTQLDFDRLLGERFFARWANSATDAGDTEGLGWSSSFTVYQSLRERRSLAYALFVQGDSGADVPIQDYGAQVRYRRSIFRRWLFIEGSVNVSWPRGTLAEERRINPGAGINLEMYFGDVPEREMR